MKNNIIDFKNTSAEDILKYGDLRTYYDYLKLGDANTKPFLMIAELIDNSIGSVEHYNNEHNLDWQEQLLINININFNGDPENIDGLEIIKGSYIKFTDNAKGIGLSDLPRAVKLNNKTQKRTSNSKMNVHGRGLKQSVYYFGIDWELLSTTEEDGSYSVAFIMSEKEEKQASNYWVNVEKIHEKKPLGTTIMIKNIYANKIFSISSWKSILDALQFRYIRYLKHKNIKINFVMENRGKYEGTFQIAEEPKQSFGEIFEILDKDEKKLDLFLANAKSNLDKKVKNQKTENSLDEDVCKDAFKEIERLLTQSFTDNKLIFEWNMSIEFLNQKNINFKFWGLPGKNAKYRGIRLFDGERAILHAGYQDSITRPYIEWLKEKVSSGSPEYRFAGECDLSEVNILTHTDKSSFKFSEEEKLRFDEILRSVFLAFTIFEGNARKDKRYAAGHTTKEAELINLEAISESKFPSDKLKFIEIEEDTKSSIFQYVDKNQKIWCIKILTDDVIKPKKIWDFLRVGDESIYITANLSHIFWKDMDKLNTSFYAHAVVPVTLLLAMQTIALDTEELSKPFDILNDIGKLFDE